MKKLLLLVLTASLIATIKCCSTKNDYHYNVIDCKEPQIAALGKYILDALQKKEERSFNPSTCFDQNIKFLKRAPFAATSTEFDPARLTAVWLYKSVHEPDAVFSGAEETLDALEKGDTYNILIDKTYKVQRYILRNTTDGSYSYAFVTEDQLMRKMSTETAWSHLDLVECSNFLHYLAKNYANQIISFTLVDRYNSNSELRWVMKTSGISGFRKKNE